jgi:RHH-type rel operon transcriptional repressor/antitoxin RelB
MITVSLPEELEARLEELARRTGRTKEFYVREAIREHLEDLEDYYTAAETLERIRKGEERVYSLDEVERRLDLDD